MASSSSSFIQNSFKYDVFLSFRGEDTRKSIVDHLYHALKDKGIYTYKDDEKIQKGKRISDDLFKSIEDSKFYIIVFSKNYASSSWCLEELVKIMECQKMPGHSAYPVFYDVEPTEVRKRIGAVGEAFAKHEKEVRNKKQRVRIAFLMNKKKDMLKKWKGALKKAAGLAGWELKNTLDGHEAKFIKKIVHEISLELRPINFGFDEKLVGMETRVKDVVSSLEVGIDEVCMIGIKGMGGAGKTTTARAVFDHLSNHFEAKSFVENVREVSNGSASGLKNLQEQVLSKVLNECVTLDSVNDGENIMKKRMCGKKVLLVLDDVDHIDQLEALAGELKWFKPGSRILITTRDEQVLVAHRANLAHKANGLHDIDLLSDKEAICLFSRHAFGRDLPSQGYQELSEKVVRYASGLPLTIKVLGSFLCGKDRVEWVDAIERLEIIPLKETMEKLELSYIGLEDDYKKIFLDIACILKGKSKINAIRVLECCGFHARNGLKVLEQRSLITISKDEVLGMHDHIEEMGKNIVRRSHPDEPNKHSRLWIEEEIEDVLAHDMGTEETRCLRHLDICSENSRIFIKGLGKMKKLRYLNVNFAGHYDKPNKIVRIVMKVLGRIKEISEREIFFPNSLKYLKLENFPFLYLPNTFQASNLVGLEMEDSKMVQVWEEGEKKVLKKLKYLSLDKSNLTAFDFRITPNLERLFLYDSRNLIELCMPVSCQKLKYLCISYSKLRTFDLGLTLNLEMLDFDCADFEELHVSVACPNLKILNLRRSRLRSLDLELIPNLEMLDLQQSHELVKINAPIECLRKVVYLYLSGCALLEKLPEDIGLLECLKVLVRTDTGISHLPQSIFRLKSRLLIVASLGLLQLYDFPSEIKTTTPSIRHEAKFIKKDVEEISQKLRSIHFSFVKNLVFMESRVKEVVSSFEIGVDEVRMIGITGMGGAGKTTIARAVVHHLSYHFEAISFVRKVSEISKASMFGLKNLQERVLSNVLNEHVSLDSVNDGKNMMKKRMCGKKVLLVLDDMDHIEQLEALTGELKWFKPGSRILITTRDEQVLMAHRVNLIHDIDRLSDKKAICLFSRYAFGRENPLQGYEELSGKVVRYAVGVPLTIIVLGLLLCGKDMVEWEDAIKILKIILLKETLEKLELSYNSQSLGFII